MTNQSDFPWVDAIVVVTALLMLITMLVVIALSWLGVIR